MITTLRWQNKIANIVRNLIPNVFIVSGNGLATELKLGLFNYIEELDAIAHSEGDDVIIKICYDVKQIKQNGIESAGNRSQRVTRCDSELVTNLLRPGPAGPITPMKCTNVHKSFIEPPFNSNIQVSCLSFTVTSSLTIMMEVLHPPTLAFQLCPSKERLSSSSQWSQSLSFPRLLPTVSSFESYGQ